MNFHEMSSNLVTSITSAISIAPLINIAAQAAIGASFHLTSIPSTPSKVTSMTPKSPSMAQITQEDVQERIVNAKLPRKNRHAIVPKSALPERKSNIEVFENQKKLLKTPITYKRRLTPPQLLRRNITPIQRSSRASSQASLAERRVTPSLLKQRRLSCRKSIG